MAKLNLYVALADLRSPLPFALIRARDLNHAAGIVKKRALDLGADDGYHIVDVADLIASRRKDGLPAAGIVAEINVGDPKDALN